MTNRIIPIGFILCEILSVKKIASPKSDLVIVKVVKVVVCCEGK